MVSSTSSPPFVSAAARTAPLSSSSPREAARTFSVPSSPPLLQHPRLLRFRRLFFSSAPVVGRILSSPPFPSLSLPSLSSIRSSPASSSRRVLYPSVHRILSDEVVRFLLLLLLDDDDDDDDDYHYDSSSSSSSLVRDS